MLRVLLFGGIALLAIGLIDGLSATSCAAEPLRFAE